MRAPLRWVSTYPLRAPLRWVSTYPLRVPLRWGGYAIGLCAALSACDSYPECGTGYCLASPRIAVMSDYWDVVPTYGSQRFTAYEESDRDFFVEGIDLTSEPPGAFVVEVYHVWMGRFASLPSAEFESCRGSGVGNNASLDCLFPPGLWVDALGLEVRRAPEHPADRPAEGVLRLVGDGRSVTAPVRLGPPEPWVDVAGGDLPCVSDDMVLRHTTIELRNTGVAAFEIATIEVFAGRLDTSERWLLTFEGRLMTFAEPEVEFVYTLRPGESLAMDAWIATTDIEPLFLSWRDREKRSWGALIVLHDACD